MKTPSFYSPDVDVSSHWFHNAEDVLAVYRCGWMEYEFRQFSPWFPNVQVSMSAFPLLPEDGLLVHYRIRTDQRLLFCVGFGGITDFISRLEYPQVAARHFSAADCRDNTVVCGPNRALLTAANGNAMWVGASFPVQVDVGDALSLQEDAPAMFLAKRPCAGDPAVVKMHCPLAQGQELDGYIVAVRNADEEALDRWLRHPDPSRDLKQRIHAKKASVTVHTPDTALNLTVPSTILAMDASWHRNTFYHGAHAYHAPFLGWRNWYGPTVIGWHDRVRTAIRANFGQVVSEPPSNERVWYDGGKRPDLDHEGSQYHQIRNSSGFVPAILGANDIYTMQEVAVDMLLHHLEWQGDLALAAEMMEKVTAVLAWEERILDPDRDGLYQNFLNTWVSDGHSYNGGGCAQASAYNCAANTMMAKVAAKLGLPTDVFVERAARIRAALQAQLWLPSRGLMAEFVDTIGHRLVHPSPELATIYLCIDAGVVDPFQAYQMLRFTETELRNERTLGRGGRLVFSSNWYPRKYSTCGLFAAENIHLALAYFQVGARERGLDILNAIVDAYFLGKNPGLCSHVLTAHGVSDGGDLDFSDVSSMYLRLVVEGLYGIRFHLLDGQVDIAPNFPAEWTHAALHLADISLNYCRDGDQEHLTVHCAAKARRRVRLPLRATRIEGVLLNGALVDYQLEAAVNACFLVVDAGDADYFHLQVLHGVGPLPTLTFPGRTAAGNGITLTLSRGTILSCHDPSSALAIKEVREGELRATVGAVTGWHTVFVQVRDQQYEAWLAADVLVEGAPVTRQSASAGTVPNAGFAPLDLSALRNSSLTELHSLEYRRPRPEGYSIGMRLNGRYAWDWNQGGHNAVVVDDRALRQAQGLFRTPSGIPFAVPENGANLACVSVWDNFPCALEIPIEGRATELALLLICSTNPMQSWVDNARITVSYRDGSAETVSLVNPVNVDDWLNAAIQTQNETVYFSDTNHAIVQRLFLDPGKELARLTVEAIANEIILGLLGVSIRR
jgi:hypothetical protein